MKEDMLSKQATYKLIADQFSTPQEIMSEIINLQAILNLPKGTEHFISDLHGEATAFFHLLKNASGVIRNKIDLVFGDMITNDEKNELALLIRLP